MNVFLKQRCLKCGGNLFLEKDIDTNQWIHHCLQCGYICNTDNSKYRSPFRIKPHRNWLTTRAEDDVMWQGVSSSVKDVPEKEGIA